MFHHVTDLLQTSFLMLAQSNGLIFGAKDTQLTEAYSVDRLPLAVQDGTPSLGWKLPNLHTPAFQRLVCLVMVIGMSRYQATHPFTAPRPS